MNKGNQTSGDGQKLAEFVEQRDLAEGNTRRAPNLHRPHNHTLHISANLYGGCLVRGIPTVPKLRETGRAYVELSERAIEMR